MMSTQSPVFLLKVASALVKEVDEKSISLADTLTSSSEIDRFKLETYVQELERDLDIAISLCKRALEMDPNVSFADEAPNKVISSAFFRHGFLKGLLKKYKDAVKYYEESLKYEPDQATYFNIGLAFIKMRGLFTDRTQDAVSAFQKCIQLDPESEMAIKAGKELARLRKL
jgi:tetratricopeptide (TPR) repeat protein